MITVLTGGTGGAKFVWGLAQIIPADQLTVIVNTGDDLTWWGLHVSPDLDSVMYALAGRLSPERGWGLDGESFRCLARMKELGAEGWFQLGDLDLATHLRRSEMLALGKPLSEATRELCRAMRVGAQLLPMSDDTVETRVITRVGDLAFQEYFVRERSQPDVLDVKFRHAERARTAPGVLEAIAKADMIFVAPSNPVTSIGPILSVPGVRDVLKNSTAPVAAVSPIVGGEAVSGPAGKMMRMRKWRVSPAGIAEAYRDFAHVIIADSRDESERKAIEEQSVCATFTNTVMNSTDDKISLARFALSAVSMRREAAR
jgi:LPPG:FO 2-phospho-L-lactate transferase